MATEVLTDRGYRHADRLRVSERVFEFDIDRGELELGVLTGVRHYDGAAIIRLWNRHAFEAFVSPDHAWVTEYCTRYRVQGGEVRMNRRVADVPTSSLKSHHKLIVSAPWREHSSDPLDVDPDTALLMGLAITDGGWKRHSLGSRYRLTISQAKQPQLDILRRITSGRARETQNRAAGQYAPGEMASYDFLFTVDQTEALLTSFDLRHPHELVRVIGRLDQAARPQLLRGIMLGDGDKKQVLGQPLDKLWVLDVFQQLAALEGLAVGLVHERDFGTGRPFFIQRLRVKNRVHASNLVTTRLDPSIGWLPFTLSGTCVARFSTGVSSIVACGR